MTGVSSYGSRQELAKEESLRFEIHNFAYLPQKRGKSVKTNAVQDSHGNSWYIEVYPRGNKKANDAIDSVECMPVFRNRKAKEPNDSADYVSFFLGCSDVEEDPNKIVKAVGAFRFGSCLKKMSRKHLLNLTNM